MYMKMQGDITVLINASQKGNRDARTQLFRELALVLRRVASSHMHKERHDHTLGVDGIVTDAFMQLVNLNRMEIKDREHFVALANIFMKRVLENYRVWKEAQKRGGKANYISIHDTVISAIPFAPELFDLRDALERLGEDHPRQKMVLEMYYFEGYKQREIAEKLELGVRSIENDLRFGRAWLNRAWTI